jgi:hypothetical protein
VLASESGLAVYVSALLMASAPLVLAPLPWMREARDYQRSRRRAPAR